MNHDGTSTSMLTRSKLVISVCLRILLFSQILSLHQSQISDYAPGNLPFQAKWPLGAVASLVSTDVFGLWTQNNKCCNAIRAYPSNGWRKSDAMCIYHICECDLGILRQGTVNDTWTRYRVSLSQRDVSMIQIKPDADDVYPSIQLALASVHCVWHSLSRLSVVNIC